jgi:hypothetical protein
MINALSRVSQRKKPSRNPVVETSLAPHPAGKASECPCPFDSPLSSRASSPRPVPADFEEDQSPVPQVPVSGAVATVDNTQAEVLLTLDDEDEELPSNSNDSGATGGNVPTGIVPSPSHLAQLIPTAAFLAPPSLFEVLPAQLHDAPVDMSFPSMNPSSSWTPTSLPNGGTEAEDTPMHREIYHNEVATLVPFDLEAMVPTPELSLTRSYETDDKGVPAQDLAMALAFLDSPDLGLWDSFELGGQGQEDFLNFPNALDLSFQSWLQPGHVSQSLNSSGPSSSISPGLMDLNTGFPYSSGDKHDSTSQSHSPMDFQLDLSASCSSTAPLLANAARSSGRVRSHAEAFDDFEDNGENDEVEPREAFWKRLRLDDSEMDLDFEGPSVGQTYGGTSQAQRHCYDRERAGRVRTIAGTGNAR